MITNIKKRKNRHLLTYICITKNTNMKETDVQRSLCKWIRIQHPHLLFMSDYYSFLSRQNRFGLEAMRCKNMPDLFICNPIGGFKGLFIEIKADKVKILKKDGSYTSEHIQGQAEILIKLNSMGYKATFGIGLEECMKIVNEYVYGE